MTYEEFWHPLRRIYDAAEARAVGRYALETAMGLTMADIAGGAVEQLTEEQTQRLSDMQQRLLRGEPVQYVVGLAYFGGRQLRVAPGVLIPRPETYELCQWVVADQRAAGMRHCRILDIGTGSGCIACTLAAELTEAELTAWDVSPVALDVARGNACGMGVDVSFELTDVLQVPCGRDCARWDIIVSNPPYVCDSEAGAMDHWVLDYEPGLALFVPDDDPLLFYRHIGTYAQTALGKGGALYLEINARYGQHVEHMLLALGFGAVTVRKDQFGKNRFVKAIWNAGN